MFQRRLTKPPNRPRQSSSTLQAPRLRLPLQEAIHLPCHIPHLPRFPPNLFPFFFCVIPQLYRSNTETHSRSGLRPGALFLCPVSAFLVTVLIELKLRAERRMGELLKAMKRQGRGRPEKKRTHPGTFSLPTLSGLGYSRKQSSHLQTIAGLSEEEFEQEIAEKKEQHEEITTASIYRLAGQKQNDQERRAGKPPGEMSRIS